VLEKRPHGARPLSVRGQEAAESKKPWDYYKQLAVVPGDKAFPSAKDFWLPGYDSDHLSSRRTPGP